MAPPEPVRPLRFAGDSLEILDQTLLPGREVWLSLTRPDEVIEAISSLRVRGAPLLGIAGAYALVLAAGGEEEVRRAAPAVASARPTAVNLRWAVERMLRALDARKGGGVRETLRAEADRIRDEDLASCRAIGRHGAALLPARATLLTHCNAGALATAGYGTALGIVYAAVASGRVVAVYADETRPLLQGARLTAWELGRAGIPVTLLADGAAGSLLRRGGIDAVVVGADRIAANGDVANKIGTYPLAVLARENGVPFYVAAPRSTIDAACPDGDSIPIEERPAAELTESFGLRTAPPGVCVHAPAFDVTPARLVTALVTETGVLTPLDAAGIAATLASP
ncbi:MAG: S-methyl-5-thioribose-1-phosphate isomerase [Planctomycetaceae bacterium]